MFRLPRGDAVPRQITTFDVRRAIRIDAHPDRPVLVDVARVNDRHAPGVNCHAHVGVAVDLTLDEPATPASALPLMSHSTNLPRPSSLKRTPAALPL